MELTIRKIAIDDIDEITELFIDTYKRQPWNETWKREIAREKIKDAAESNIAENYCIIKESKIIGAMFAKRNYFTHGKELYIDEFFIENSNQRRGIGKYFLEYIEKDLKEKNYTAIILLTQKGLSSELFYAKNGFRTSPRMILMVKDIE